MASLAEQLKLDLVLRYQNLELEVSEEIYLSGVTTLFGPSGAGKSTLLRVVAGIERSALGQITYMGIPWLDSKTGLFVPPHKRAVAMVFQDTQLFPHLTVAGNLNYGYRRRNRRCGPEWSEVTEALDLDPLLDRDVDALSGGERQRVALGRSLLAAPRLLLLDEPLAALDAARKAEIMPYLKRVIAEFDLPIIYVTHSKLEVRLLASRVLALVNGKVVRGNESLDGARHSEHSCIRASVVGLECPGLAVCKVGEGVMLAEMQGKHAVGTEVELVIERSSMLLFAGEGGNALAAGKLDGVVSSIDRSTDGTLLHVTMSTAGGELVANLHRSSWIERQLAINDAMQVVISKPAVVSYSL